MTSSGCGMRISAAGMFHGRFRDKWMKRYLIIRGD
jgi:hypothetical protein